MTGPRDAIEFVRQLVTGGYQRAGNRVQLESADGTSIATTNPLAVELVGASPGGGGTTVLLPTDPITGALSTIDSVHNEIHEGHHFSVSYKSPDPAPVADDGIISWGIVTGAEYLHLIAEVAFGGASQLELYEESDITGGVLTTPVNHNRASTRTSTAVVWLDPTVNNAGTLLEDSFIPGGTTGRAIGAIGGQRDEWILAPNEVYLIQATNRSGVAQPGSLRCSWYEEPVN